MPLLFHVVKSADVIQFRRICADLICLLIHYDTLDCSRLTHCLSGGRAATSVNTGMRSILTQPLSESLVSRTLMLRTTLRLHCLSPTVRSFVKYIHQTNFIETSASRRPVTLRGEVDLIADGKQRDQNHRAHQDDINIHLNSLWIIFLARCSR